MGKSVIVKDLTHGSITAQLLHFVTPLLLSNILQGLYNIVDMLVVGFALQARGISALSTCSDLMSMFTFFALGFSNAGQVLVAQYTGGRQTAKTQRLIGSLFTFMALSSLCFFLFSLICGRSILAFVNTPDEAMAYAVDYLGISIYGLFFIYGYNAVSGVLRGLGDSKHPLYFVALASTLNIILDVIFVLLLGLGVNGAAWATVISQGCSFAVSFLFLYRKRGALGLYFSAADFIPRKDTFVPLAALGIPMAMKSGLIHFSKLLVARWVNIYGVNVSAVTGVGNKINSIAHMFDAAVSTSTASMIGQCVGAKKHDRVLRILAVSEVLAVGITAVISAVILIFPGQVFGLFGLDDEAYALLPRYLPVLICLIFGSAVRAPISGLINGSGKPALNYFVAFTYGIAGQIGLPALLAFKLGLGLEGLWYGYALAAYIPVFIGVLFLISGAWRTGKSWAES